MRLHRLTYFCIVLSLVPLLGLCLYNQPYLEDYANAVLGRDMGVWAGQKFLYQRWSGRFFSNAVLIALNPLTYGWLQGVKLTAVLSLVVKIALLAWALRSLTSRRISWVQAGWMAAGLVVLYVATVPNKYAAVYSFTYLGVYQLPMMLLVLAAVGADRTHRAHSVQSMRLWWTVTAGSIAAATASNEMLLLLAAWGLAAGVVASWWRGQRTLTWRWAGWLGVWAIAATFALLAPGNGVRITAESQGTLPLVLLVAQMVKQLRYELTDPGGLILLALPLLLAPIGLRLLPGRPPGLNFPLWLGAVFVLGGLVAGALPFNVMQHPVERPVDLLYWWLMLSWLVACWASLPADGARLPANRAVRLSIGLAAGILVAVTTGRAWQELLIEAPRDDRQWQQRYSMLQAARPHSNVELPPIKGVTPRHVLIRGYDIMPYYNAWNNMQMAQWFRVDSVRVNPKQLKQAAY